jgi:hypothetical protein
MHHLRGRNGLAGSCRRTAPLLATALLQAGNPPPRAGGEPGGGSGGNLLLGMGQLSIPGDSSCRIFWNFRYTTRSSNPLLRPVR